MLYIVNDYLFLMGDKRVTHTIPNKETEEGYIITGHTDTGRKIFYINNEVLIGATGSTPAYHLLTKDTILNDCIVNDCREWKYSDFKQYYDQTFQDLYGRLTLIHDNEYKKSFRLMLCGINNKHLHTTIYQYPSIFENKPHETIFDRNYNGILVFSQKKFENDYIRNYMSYSGFKSGNYSIDSVEKAFSKVLYQMSQIDDSVSLNYDIYNIHI